MIQILHQTLIVHSIVYFLHLKEKFSPPCKASLPLYILLIGILALHMYALELFPGYLSHESSAEGGGRGCLLWKHYSGVTSTLVQLIRLLQNIQCGVEGIPFQKASSHRANPLLDCCFSHLGAYYYAPSSSSRVDQLLGSNVLYKWVGTWHPTAYSSRSLGTPQFILYVQLHLKQTNKQTKKQKKKI